MDRYNLVLSEGQMKILVASLFNLGQQTLGTKKFLEDFIVIYKEVYKENGKEHLFKTRSLLPAKIDDSQFFALLFHSSQLLTQHKVYNIPEEVDNLLNDLLNRNPNLRNLNLTEIMDFFKSKLPSILEEENKKG